VLNEAAWIASGAGTLPELILERRQGTDAAAQFDCRAPAGRREVHQRQPWPAQYEDSTDNDEADEQQVQDDNAVCEDSMGHACGPGFERSPSMVWVIVAAPRFSNCR